MPIEFQDRVVTSFLWGVVGGVLGFSVVIVLVLLLPHVLKHGSDAMHLEPESR